MSRMPARIREIRPRSWRRVWVSWDWSSYINELQFRGTARVHSPFPGTDPPCIDTMADSSTPEEKEAPTNGDHQHAEAKPVLSSTVATNGNVNNDMEEHVSLSTILAVFVSVPFSLRALSPQHSG